MLLTLNRKALLPSPATSATPTPGCWSTAFSGAFTLKKTGSGTLALTGAIMVLGSTIDYADGINVAKTMDLHRAVKSSRTGCPRHLASSYTEHADKRSGGPTGLPQVQGEAQSLTRSSRECGFLRCWLIIHSAVIW